MKGVLFMSDERKPKIGFLIPEFMFPCIILNEIEFFFSRLALPKNLLGACRTSLNFSASFPKIDESFSGLTLSYITDEHIQKT